MKNFGTFILTMITLGVISFSGCYYDNEEELYGPPTQVPTCDSVQVSYQNDIAPLIDTRGCLSCHNSRDASGNINLEGHANVQKNALNGKLLGAVRHESGFSPMPQNASKLPDNEIKLIECWVEDGAPDN